MCKFSDGQVPITGYFRSDTNKTADFLARVFYGKRQHAWSGLKASDTGVILGVVLSPFSWLQQVSSADIQILDNAGLLFGHFCGAEGASRIARNSFVILNWSFEICVKMSFLILWISVVEF